MKKNDKITVITCAAAFALNVALFSVKLYVGLCANSISIYSDAVNNMFDSLSGLAAFICFAALLSSSSEGTRAIIKKAEQFFSFVMSVIILLTGLYFAYNSLERLFYPTPISYLTRYLVMLIVTVAVKFIMFFAYRGVYRITGSPIIKVMAADSILDCFITLATVMSLTVSQYVEFAVDAVFGLVISAVLVTSAVKLAKKSGAVMLDFVGSGKREEISEIFDSLGVAVDYITYRRTGTDIEAFAKPAFPENTDENEITQKLVSACKEILGVFALFVITVVMITIIGDKANIKRAESYDPVVIENQLVPEKDENGYWTFTTDRDLKIMQLTDIHLGGGWLSLKKDSQAINAVATMIQAEKPDLVIITTLFRSL